MSGREGEGDKGSLGVFWDGVEVRIKSLVNLGKNIFFTEVYFDKKTKTVYI